ncbi:MAG: CPBP family intramembrane metalloprotease [Microlunatus sp.]
MTNTTAGQDSITASQHTSASEYGPARTEPAVWWGVALRAVLALAITLVAYGPALLVVRIPGMDFHDDALAGNWWLVLLKQCGPLLLVPVAAVLLLMLCTRWIDKRPFSITGIRFDRRWLPALLLGTVISLAVIVPVAVLMTRIGLGDTVTPSGEPFWVGLLLVLAVGYGMQGITEEFVWRGWFTQSTGGGYHRQALISAAIFGLIHIASNGGHATFGEGLIYIVHAGAFGYAAAALYFATGSIWAAVGIHGGLHLGGTLAAELGALENWATNLVTLALYIVIGLVVMRRFVARTKV